MLRAIKIGAIVAIATVIGSQSAGAQTLTWGIFRENAPDISESLRNCWSQAMVSGQTINGELIRGNLTESKAEFELQSFARRGVCASERSNRSWSARGENHNRFGGSDYDRWNFDGHHGGGSNSD